MKLITFLLASTEATKLAAEASWNNGQYVPWTPPANNVWWTPQPANSWWNPEPTTTTSNNTGAWVDDSHLYDWGQWNNNDSDSESEEEVEAVNPVATLEPPATESFVVNVPETATDPVNEWNPTATIEIPTADESGPTQEELDMLDSFINTSWQNDMPWLNAHPPTTPAEEAVTAGDVAPTTDDFEDMFNEIDTAGDSDWEDGSDDAIVTVDEDGEVCVDTDNGITDDYGDGCDEYAEFLEWCGLYDTRDFKSMEMCCACKDVEITNPYAGPDFDVDTCEDNMDVVDVYGDDCS